MKLILILLLISAGSYADEPGTCVATCDADGNCTPGCSGGSPSSGYDYSPDPWAQERREREEREEQERRQKRIAEEKRRQESIELLSGHARGEALYLLEKALKQSGTVTFDSGKDYLPLEKTEALPKFNHQISASTRHPYPANNYIEYERFALCLRNWGFKMIRGMDFKGLLGCIDGEAFDSDRLKSAILKNADEVFSKKNLQEKVKEKILSASGLQTIWDYRKPWVAAIRFAEVWEMDLIARQNTGGLKIIVDGPTPLEAKRAFDEMMKTTIEPDAEKFVDQLLSSSAGQIESLISQTGPAQEHDDWLPLRPFIAEQMQEFEVETAQDLLLPQNTGESASDGAKLFQETP